MHIYICDHICLSRNISDCQKEILTTWSSANTPENSDLKIGTLANCKNLPEDSNPQAELPLEQMPLTYQTLIDRIIQPRCLKCHNANSDDLEAAGILFYPYEQIVSRVNLWEAPGAQSKVVEFLTRTDDERMPPPEDSNPLSIEEISFFTRWIDAGKPQ